VNVGTGIGSQKDEIESIKWAVETIKHELEIPICIDSADPGVIEAGLDLMNGNTAMINSVKAEKESLESVVPLAVHYNSLLVALAMDTRGIPDAVVGRLEACDTIVSVCEKYKLPVEKVYFDPLVMPISTDINSGKVALKTISAVKERFPGAKTVTGLSNISYGLPERGRMNTAFLHMCIYAGLDAAITDPLDESLMGAVKTAEVLVGKDRYCRRYLKMFRR